MFFFNIQNVSLNAILFQCSIDEMTILVLCKYLGVRITLGLVEILGHLTALAYMKAASQGFVLFHV